MGISRNYLYCIMLVLFVFALTGCGGSNSDPVFIKTKLLTSRDIFYYDNKTVDIDVVATDVASYNAIIDNETVSEEKTRGSDYQYIQDKTTGAIYFAGLTKNGDIYNIDNVYIPAFPANPKVGYKTKMTNIDGLLSFAMEITGTKYYMIDNVKTIIYNIKYTIITPDNVVHIAHKSWSQTLGWYTEDDDSKLVGYVIYY